MRRQLLTDSDIRYQRRLVKVLNINHSVDGFMCYGARFNRARIRDGWIEGQRVGPDPGWRQLDPGLLFDLNGQQITAPRAVKL